MDIKAGLYAYIVSKSLFRDLCSTRLFPDEATQNGTIPYVTYRCEDSKHTTHISGASALADYFFTLTVHAATSESRAAIVEALRNILHMRRNVSWDGPIAVRLVKLEGIHDAYLPPTDGSETNGMFEAEMDFRIVFQETAPTLP